MGFAKENNEYSIKLQKKRDLQLLVINLTKKTPDARNAKEHYQSFLRKKHTKQVKQSKIVTQQPKSTENSNVIGIKPVAIEHPKT